MTFPSKICAALSALVLLLMIAECGPSVAQQPPLAQTKPDTSTSSSDDARLVDIPVVVYNKKGDVVGSLTKDDFVLQVDGHPRTIRTFKLNPDVPLTLGLLVDTSVNQRDGIEEERAASSALLDAMLNGSADRDKGFVVQFGRQTDLLQDVTASKPQLKSALKQLDAARVSGKSAGDRSSVEPVDSKSAHVRRDGNTLYDALYLSSNEVIGKQKGRKVMILLSDGVDAGSKESASSAIEAALRADAVVYAIYFKGKVENDRGFHVGQPDDPDSYPGGGYPGGGYPGSYPGGGYPGGGYPSSYPGRQPQNLPVADGKKTLQHIAEQTGGRFFEASKKETVSDIYKEIGDELRAQYRLGYALEKDTSSDGYHRIAVSLNKSGAKDLYLRTREGYYSGD